MPILTGDIIGGKYRVERVLGEGGMGIVVAARHLDLEELYAIKIMKRESIGNDAYAERRFIEEAKAAARLKSVHLAHVHDVGRLGTGELYMVMEYLKGSDLKTLVCTHGPVPVTVAVSYMLQACEAMKEAHSWGIVHRDIKPNNIFLLKDTGLIKVLDFGISKHPAVYGADLTGSNVMLGTLSYMSPEQFQKSKNVDVRSDIWSLGVVLYELVTGSLPFLGDGIIEVFTRVTTERPRPPSMLQSRVPYALDMIVARCLQVDPGQRFQNVQQLALALQSVGVEVSTSPVSRTSGDFPRPSQESKNIENNQSKTGRSFMRGACRHPILYLPVGILVAAALVPWLTSEHADREHVTTDLSSHGLNGPRTGYGGMSSPSQLAKKNVTDMGTLESHANSRNAKDGYLDAMPSYSAPNTPIGDGDMMVSPLLLLVPSDDAHRDAGAQVQSNATVLAEQYLEKQVSAVAPSRDGLPTAKRTARQHASVSVSIERSSAMPPNNPRVQGDVPSAVAHIPKTGYCVATHGTDFSMLVDLRRYTREQRGELVAQGECQGDRSRTSLCCRSDYVDAAVTH